MKLLTKVKQHIFINIKVYAWVLAAFSAGFIIAAFSVFSMNETNNSELLIYIDDFFENLSVSGAVGNTILKNSFLSSFKTVVLAFMFSLMIIGTPFLWIICAACGYSASFCLLFMFKNYSVRAFLFVLTGLLPHWLISVPAYAFFMASCFKFSLMLSGHLKGAKTGQGVWQLIAVSITALIFMLAACLIQAYIEPYLLGIVSKYYI